jgi:hypothetical protein
MTYDIIIYDTTHDTIWHMIWMIQHMIWYVMIWYNTWYDMTYDIIQHMHDMTYNSVQIILDRRPASSRNCRGPVNTCGHRTVGSSQKSVCSPVFIIFYFNSGSRYQNFYTWFPATSQYDFGSMSLSKKRFKELHWFVFVNVSWKHWFVIVNVSWKVSRCGDTITL